MNLKNEELKMLVYLQQFIVFIITITFSRSKILMSYKVDESLLKTHTQSTVLFVDDPWTLVHRVVKDIVQ